MLAVIPHMKGKCQGTKLLRPFRMAIWWQRIRLLFRGLHSSLLCSNLDLLPPQKADLWLRISDLSWTHKLQNFV